MKRRGTGTGASSVLVGALTLTASILLMSITLTACSTRYQHMGFAGGVSAERMTADTFRIVARGNGYTDATTIQDYALLKAAETTVAAGGTHFVVVSAA